MTLERVYGQTVSSVACLAYHPTSGDLAYTAGSCLVFLDQDLKQSFLLQRPGLKRPIAFGCLSFSQDGHWLATGETFNHNASPEIVIWERKDDGPTWVERQGLKGHKIGVAQVGFSRNGQYLVSLGDNEDRGLIVWDLQRGGKQEKRMFSNKLGKPVYQFYFFFGAGSEFFVTAGQDHFKFWYFEDAMKNRNPQQGEVPMLESQSADLSKIKVKSFIGVQCLGIYVYGLSQDGCLYKFNRDRQIEMVIQTKLDKPLCLHSDHDMLLCGGHDGQISLISVKTGQLVNFQFPKPPPICQPDKLVNVQRKAIVPVVLYPDVTALAYSAASRKISVIYSDGLMLQWTFEDLAPKEGAAVEKMKQFQIASTDYLSFNHVKGVQDLVPLTNQRLGDGTALNLDQEIPISYDSGELEFVTCGLDQTFRLWSYDTSQLSTEGKSLMPKIVQQQNLQQPQEDSKKPKQSILKQQGRYNYPYTTTAGKSSDAILDQPICLSCLSISPDCSLLLGGDTQGTLYLYQLPSLAPLLTIPAHDAEVTCLGWSPTVHPLPIGAGGGPGQGYMIATASRDRLTHVYYLKITTGRNEAKYENVGVYQDHEGTVSGLSVVEEVNAYGKRRVKVVTVGQDKGMTIRVASKDGKFEVDRRQAYTDRVHAVGVTRDAGYVVTVHETFIQMQQLSKKKGEAVWKQKLADPIVTKFEKDSNLLISEPGVSFKVLEHCFVMSDRKQVMLFELASGSLLAKTSLISSTSTLNFIVTSNLRHLIITSSPVGRNPQGIIQVWRIPQLLVEAQSPAKQLIPPPKIVITNEETKEIPQDKLAYQKSELRVEDFVSGQEQVSQVDQGQPSQISQLEIDSNKYIGGGDPVRQSLNKEVERKTFNEISQVHKSSFKYVSGRQDQRDSQASHSSSDFEELFPLYSQNETKQDQSSLDLRFERELEKHPEPVRITSEEIKLDLIQIQAQQVYSESVLQAPDKTPLAFEKTASLPKDDMQPTANPARVSYSQLFQKKQYFLKRQLEQRQFQILRRPKLTESQALKSDDEDIKSISSGSSSSSDEETGNTSIDREMRRIQQSLRKIKKMAKKDQEFDQRLLSQTGDIWDQIINGRLKLKMKVTKK